MKRRIAILCLVLALLVLPLSQPERASASGGIRQILTGGFLDSPSTSTTEYNSIGSTVLWDSVESHREHIIPCSGTLRNLYVELEQNATNGGYTFTVRKNGAATDLAVAITSGNKTGEDTESEISFSAGDRIAMECDPGSPAPGAQSYVRYHVEFEPDEAGISILMSNNYCSSAADRYGDVSNASAITGYTAYYRGDLVIPYGCTVSDFYVHFDQAPDPGLSDGYDIRVEKCILAGADQYTGIAVVISGDNVSGSDTSNTDDLTAGEYLRMEILRDGTPANDCYAAMGLVVEPDTSGFFLMAGTYQAPDASNPRYCYPTCTRNSQPWASTESDAYQVSGEMTLKNMYVRIGVNSSYSPGEGASWTINLRVNGAATDLVVVIADSARYGSDQVHEVEVSDGDYLDWQITPSGTPITAGAYFRISCMADTTLAPTVTGCTPDHGARGDTMEAVLDGTSFTTATSVSFGTGITVNDFNIDSDVQITCNITIAVDAPLGDHDVSVTNPTGTGTLTDGFEVTYPAPTVTGCTPDHGARGDTMEAVLDGTSFTTATSVSFGTGITVNDFNIDSDLQITCDITIAVDAPLGDHDVSVTNPTGTGTLTDGFEVTYPAPTVTGCTPDHGARGDTMEAVLDGTSFTTATSVSFGTGITVNDFNIDSDLQITCDITIAVDAPLGDHDVSVTNPTGTGTLTDGFEVTYPAPTVTGCTPDHGARGDTMEAVLNGTSFTTATNVSFGTGVTVNDFDIDSDVQITCNITIAVDAPLGDHDVSVTNPTGTGILTDGFEVTYPAPTVTGCTPAAEDQGETLEVVLAGTSFTTATNVSFGTGVTVNDFDIDSDVQITCNITIAVDAPLGVHDVSVTNSTGTGTLTGGFEVTEPPAAVYTMAEILPYAFVGISVVLVMAFFVITEFSLVTIIIGGIALVVSVVGAGIISQLIER